MKGNKTPQEMLHERANENSYDNWRDFSYSCPSLIEEETASVMEAYHAQFGDQAERWRRVEDGKPPEGNNVLILSDYSPKGKRVREIGFYTQGGKLEFEDENEDWPETFDEEKQCSFLPEGFWVHGEDEEKLFQRHKVTHWQPLPSPPLASPEGETNN